MALENYYYVINIEDDETGMMRTSLVQNPATKIEFELFDEVVVEENFNLNEDKRIITGVIMTPNVKLLRKFKNSEQYYNCMFTEESISNMVKKASKQGVLNNINLNHSKDPQDQVKGVYMIESILVSDHHKSALFPDAPNGTWIASFWVEDKEFWENRVKTDGFKGFSIEVTAEIIKADFEEDMIKTAIEYIMNSDLSDDEKRADITTLLEKCTVNN